MDNQQQGIINYSDIIKNYSWIVEPDQKCIISPDSDGILCGLFMSSFFNWEIVGYYDGKELAIKKNVKPSDCVFLDMEIFRKDCRSIGQHMLRYNQNDILKKWDDNFKKCINPNLIRKFDKNKNWKQKYPLGTIHLLMCIARTKIEFSLPQSAITVLLYVDGTFKNLLNYPENCISWLKFLDAKNEKSPIAPLLNIFATQRISTMMHDLEEIFGKFRNINGGKRGGDKIKISEIQNEKFPDALRNRTNALINFLSEQTKWKFIQEKWAMDNLNVFKLKKKIEMKLNGKKFSKIINREPFSFAITREGGKGLEYTLVGKIKLF